MPEPRPAPDESNAFVAAHARLLIESYHRLTGLELVDPGLRGHERSQALFEAPFVVASHDTQADPVFNYANRAALELWETTWAAFTAMPSRLSAEPVAREEREGLLARVKIHGYVDDYQGVRISSRGRRFLIRRATVWNVIDSSGVYRGQAVMFSEWDAL